MSQFDELLDRRNFSETVDAILYTRPRFTAIFFPLFALVFFAALGWLAFVPFEQTVQARGDLRVAGVPAAVRAQQEGRLTFIGAREGALVEKGAVLFRLDDTTPRMDLERVADEIARVTQTIALLGSQRERAASRNAVELGRMGRDIARHRALFEGGILPKEMVENLESERSARVEAARQEQLALETEVVAARQALDRLENDRSRILRTMHEQTIRAAEPGVVTRLLPGTNAPSAGQFVARGAVLAEITPRGRALEFEGVVAPHDIARVRTGLPARIELDAYPRRQFGALDGRVTFVAPDRGERGYRVRIAVDAPPRGIELRTGLPGTVSVISDRRPLFRAVGERLGLLR
ncbi:MAG TPA: HlyD family efflux transporter periplasmic adaptor subunit [Thermoanaerobaculia bacterium]|nr:HlyD family efflux transporter periplasmic adaptor subunit [Thermoanaerobaculia bacterium]